MNIELIITETDMERSYRRLCEEITGWTVMYRSEYCTYLTHRWIADDDNPLDYFSFESQVMLKEAA